MDGIKTTVYIPSHNYGKFLEKAIESVLRQSSDGWELLLIDDNSTDNTSEIINLYRGDPRVRCFRTEGIGLIGVCNLALKEARGKYIIRLDGDDIFDENILLVLSNHLEAHQESVLVFPDFYYIDEIGGIISHERRERLYENNHILDVPANGACTLIRAGVLREMGGYRDDIDSQDGFDLWTKMCKKYRCDNINLPLFQYRRHGANLTEKTYRIVNSRRFIKQYAVTPEMEQHRPLIAVIPCRKNYDFVPDIWNEKLNGKTLLERSLAVCTQSEVFDMIVVASDTEDVKATMEQYDDTRLMYYQRNSDDTIRSRSLAITLDKITNEFDPERRGVSVLAYNQAPFKTTSGLEEAVYTTLLGSADSSIAMLELSKRVFQRTANGMRALNPLNGINSDFNTVFIEARTTQASMNRNFARGTLTGSTVVNFVVPEEEAFFIGSPRDLMVAKVMAKL